MLSQYGFHSFSGVMHRRFCRERMGVWTHPKPTPTEVAFMEALGFDPEQIQQRTCGFNTRGFPIFNARMRQARRNRGLTQRDLAAIVGVSAILISHIEMLRIFPTPKLAQSIAEALGQEAGTLFPRWLHFYLREMRVVYVVRQIKPGRIDELQNSGTLTPAVVDPEVVYSKTRLRREVEWALAVVQIEPDDRFVMEHRFGLNGETEKTFAKIGRQLGINPETLRRREVNALRRLRHPSVARRLRDFLE